MANIKRANTSGVTKSGVAIADVPDAPTIGTATSSILSASITFTAATTGGTATTYTATSSPDSITGTSSTSPITVSGLTGGTAYTFTVTPSNSTGTGAASSASNSVTIADLVNGYDALGAVTLSEATASVTFSGIPTGYSHLQIRAINRDSNTDTNINSLYITFNGVSGTSYSWHRIQGFGAGSPATYGLADQGNIWIGPSATNGYTSNIFSGHIIDVLDYSSDQKYKTVKHMGGFDTNGTGTEPGEINLTSGLFKSLDPIVSITINKTGQNQLANSQFALYGVK